MTRALNWRGATWLLACTLVVMMAAALLSTQADAGIRQRKERHYHKRRQPVQRMLQAQQWGRDAFAGPFQADDGLLLPLACHDEQVASLRAIEVIEQAASPG